MEELELAAVFRRERAGATTPSEVATSWVATATTPRMAAEPVDDREEAARRVDTPVAVGPLTLHDANRKTELRSARRIIDAAAPTAWKSRPERSTFGACLEQAPGDVDGLRRHGIEVEPAAGTGACIQKLLAELTIESERRELDGDITVERLRRERPEGVEVGIGNRARSLPGRCRVPHRRRNTMGSEEPARPDRVVDRLPRAIRGRTTPPHDRRVRSGVFEQCVRHPGRRPSRRCNGFLFPRRGTA